MSFNTKTAVKLTGLTPRQVDYWDRTHFIKPSVNDQRRHQVAPGSGGGEEEKEGGGLMHHMHQRPLGIPLALFTKTKPPNSHAPIRDVLVDLALN